MDPDAFIALVAGLLCSESGFKISTVGKRTSELNPLSVVDAPGMMIFMLLIYMGVILELYLSVHFVYKTVLIIN